MSRTSPTKEEAIRLTKLFEYAMKNQFVDIFGAEPTMAQVAEKLGYPEERLRSILNGNAYRASIEKVARAVTAWVADGSLNADYVIIGGKAKMLKKPKRTEAGTVEEKPAEEALPIVEMDDELDDMEVAEAVVVGDEDEELTELPEIADDDENGELQDISGEEQSAEPEHEPEPEQQEHIEDTANGYHVDAVASDDSSTDVLSDAIESAHKTVGPKDKSKKTVIPKTAKDHWIDAAIDLGISADALNDHFMQLFSTRDGRLHLFKEPEGKLPYRQEIYEVQAVGLGKPSVISYYDDKVRYAVKYAVVHKGEIAIEAANENDAYTKLFEMLTRNKYYVNGKEQVYSYLCTDIDPIKED